MLNVFARARVSVLMDPIGKRLAQAGVSPNVVTWLGTAGVLIGTLGFVTRGHLLGGMVIVTVSVLTDLLDGAIARANGGGSKWGAFLDSTLDRVCDGAVFGSLAYWLIGPGDKPGAGAAALICLVAGFVISYAKARAEGLGMTCNVGIAERSERLILVGIGAVLWMLGIPGAIDVVLWLLAVLSVFTVAQRVLVVRRQSSAG
jgi:CDP-diacylglycerol--glycerol-3-phosphate 3-phosphatidyltransferase